MLARQKKDALTQGCACLAAVDAAAKKKPRNKGFRLVEYAAATHNLFVVCVARRAADSFAEVKRGKRVKVFSWGWNLWVKKRGKCVLLVTATFGAILLLERAGNTSVMTIRGR
jgi:hypothetical protein